MKNNKNQLFEHDPKINQVDSVEQLQPSNKTELRTKISFTIILYIILLFVSFSIFFISNYIQMDPESRWIYADFETIWTTFYIYGVVGLFTFPFLPLIISLLVIFAIVHILEKWKIITNHKKILLALFVFSLVPIIGIGVFDTTKQMQHKQQATQERNYYEQIYETKKPVESKNIFIYPKNDEIIISDIYGNNKKNIYSYTEKNIGYVSPNGKYFVNCEPYGKYGDCHSLLSVDNPSKKTDLCIMKTSDDRKVCPEFCDWDPSASSFMCKYKFYGFLDKDKEKSPSDKNILVLFSPRNGKHKVISQDSSSKSIQNFALTNKDTLIFTNQEKFYKAENLYECQTKISEMENLSECDNFILENSNIYCPVKAEKYNIEIKDKENFWVGWRDYFIVKQNLNQSSPKDYSVVNKAPIPETEILFNVDDKFIFTILEPGGIKILDTKTGLTRNMGGDYAFDKKIEIDDNLIFEEYTDIDIKKIPKLYMENTPAPDNIDLQECKISENPPDPDNVNEQEYETNDKLQSKLGKWENEKLSFEYEIDDFYIQTIKSSGMIHLIEKENGLEYAAIHSYIIENGLTLDMIFDNTKKMGSSGGYYDVMKKKIGDRDFVVYLTKWENGKYSSMNYETVINNKYHLSIINNFFNHERNAESISKIENFIKSIYVKNY